MVTVSDILIIGINTAKNSGQSEQADLDPSKLDPNATQSIGTEITCVTQHWRAYSKQIAGPTGLTCGAHS